MVHSYGIQNDLELLCQDLWVLTPNPHLPSIYIFNLLHFWVFQLFDFLEKVVGPALQGLHVATPVQTTSTPRSGASVVDISKIRGLKHATLDFCPDFTLRNNIATGLSNPANLVYFAAIGVLNCAITLSYQRRICCGCI